MVGSRRVQGAGSAQTEGARRASGVGADGAAVGAGALAPGQRWSASRKRDVVLRLLRGESLEMVSREVGVELYRLEAWQARALAGLELGLKAQGGEPLAAELDAATRHTDELREDLDQVRTGRWPVNSRRGLTAKTARIAFAARPCGQRAGAGPARPVTARERSGLAHGWQTGPNWRQATGPSAAHH